MIEVIYRGRLGNNLFQYCFGRILAEELGWKLQADPIPGFPNTAQTIDGEDYSEREPTPYIWQEKWQDIVADQTKRKIVVYGYFQNYDNFRPYKDQIRSEWLVCNIQRGFEVQRGDLVLHVRRGDYVRMGHALPFHYYEKLLRKATFDRLVILTDDPEDPFFESFKSYDPVVPQLSSEEAFRVLLDAPAIALSQSSFSWWGAFLSQAERIYFPEPFWGYWSGAQEYQIKLQVRDESRYEYVKCEPTFTERLRVFYWRSRIIRGRLRDKLIGLVGAR